MNECHIMQLSDSPTFKLPEMGAMLSDLTKVFWLQLFTKGRTIIQDFDNVSIWATDWLYLKLLEHYMHTVQWGDIYVNIELHIYICTNIHHACNIYQLNILPDYHLLSVDRYFFNQCDFRYVVSIEPPSHDSSKWFSGLFVHS